ncbi:intermembrane phospholipid transport protein YdbH family protein [Kangiella spongicola]|uniref:Uncharacterized protein n=1 Tax=Kangiella spongicola TaxID=796379 RepID=A0A318D983_9GAMM|nr:YdbH domain-containing protein [Kangiella spongicola]PXF64475.1 hypothetical protein DL796_04875 [Kangiella spongicola]
MQSKATPKKSWLKTTLKITLWFLLLITLTLAIAYWTAPSWVPSQISKFLPPSIKLQNLEFKRPGLTSTDIDNLTLVLSTSVPEGDDIDARNSYTVNLKQVRLGYSLWQRKLTSISAQSAHLQWPESRSGNQQSEVAQTIPLPNLPVSDIVIKKLTLDGLTVQSILANDITIKETPNSVSLSSQLVFLDKEFVIEAKAQRVKQTLTQLSARVTQAGSQLTVEAEPHSTKHWKFDAKGLLDITEFYAEPGIEPSIEPVQFDLVGSLELDDSISLNLLDTSLLSTQLDAQKLGLITKIDELLQANYINSNLKQLNPQYHLALSPVESANFLYHPTKQQFSIEHGRLDINVMNPAVTAAVSLSQLQLDLNQALTAEAQRAQMMLSLAVNGISAKFKSPEHQAKSDTLNFSMTTQALLHQSSLLIKDASAKVSLAPVSYRGNNSTATVAQNSWTLKGQSAIHFANAKQNNHQWNLSLDKPVNPTLQLDAEQFSAKGVSAQLNYTQNTKAPSGLLTGNYQLNQLSLKQQPLNLSGLKGSIQFVTNQSPKGHLSFSSANYKGQQVGFSNISGVLDWSKLNDRFLAQGSLSHQQSKVPFNYQFNLANSKHNLKIKQSSLPVSTIRSWVTVLKDYPQLSFNAGNLEISSLDGDPVGLFFNGKLKLDKFNLKYDEFEVKNWTIEDSLTPSSKLSGTLKSHIESIELATDIAITDISFLMPHTIDSVEIIDLKGKLLNGTIGIPNLTINKNGISPFITNLRSIDINALLKALNSQDLTLTGRFDFTLPLTVSEQGQQITNGHFKALGEGIIKLKSKDSKNANIAFQALENFHYKEFSGTINYNLEGDYTIALSVLGSNPNLYNGFPVKLDLTLRGKLPKLLYSMIVTGDMTKPILDDLKQQQILNIQ